MSDTDEITTWRSPDGTRFIVARLSFAEAEIVGADLSYRDLATVMAGDRPDASLGEQLEALSVLVKARSEAKGWLPL